MSWQRKFGAVIVGLVALAALVTLVWTPYDPLQADVASRLEGPSRAHWMGTDQYGRDIASRVMDGARLTLTVAVGAVGLSALVGVPLGIWAGMRRGASRVVMAGADLLLAFPALLLAIVFTAVFGASIWIVVLAIGIVVDDAIVVLENIVRRRQEGLGARAAAVLGTREVFFAVIATTLTLAAVFVPISFLPGQTGGLFREFGFTLAISILLSSIVALTLCPVMASRLRRSDMKEAEGGRIWHMFQGAYDRTLKSCLNAPLVVLTLAALFGFLAFLLWGQLRQELTPEEDRALEASSSKQLKSLRKLSQALEAEE